MSTNVSRKLKSVPCVPVLRVYGRMSTQGQTDSLHRQTDQSVKTCATEILPAKGIKVPNWSERVEYLDGDRSGADFVGREEFNRLMTETRAGDIVVIESSSRFGRKALKTASALETLIERKARVFWASGVEVHMQSGTDAIIAVANGAGDQAWRESIQEETRNALRSRLADGYIAGSLPYGYTSVEDPSTVTFVKKVRKSKKRAEVVEAEAETVRRIYSLYLAGTGIFSIVLELNKPDGPKPAKSDKWCKEAIRKILANEKYRGTYTHGLTGKKRVGEKRVNIPGEHGTVTGTFPRIIDDETWYAVQAARQARFKEFDNTVSHVNPLVGLARCKLCGATITASGGRKSHYTCTARRRKGPDACELGVYQPIGIVESALFGWIKENVLTDANIDRLIASVQARLDKQVPAVAVDLVLLDGEIAKLEKQIARLINLAAESDEPIAEALSGIATRKAGIRKLQAQRSEATRPKVKATPVEVAPAVREAVRELAASLESDPDRAGVALRRLFPDGLLFSAALDGVFLIEGSACLTDGNPDGNPDGEPHYYNQNSPSGVWPCGCAAGQVDSKA